MCNPVYYSLTFALLGFVVLVTRQGGHQIWVVLELEVYTQAHVLNTKSPLLIVFSWQWREIRTIDFLMYHGYYCWSEVKELWSHVLPIYFTSFIWFQSGNDKKPCSGPIYLFCIEKAGVSIRHELIVDCGSKVITVCFAITPDLCHLPSGRTFDIYLKSPGIFELLTMCFLSHSPVCIPKEI